MSDEKHKPLVMRKSPLGDRPDIFRGTDGWIWSLKGLPADQAEFAAMFDELTASAEDYLADLRNQIIECLQEKDVGTESVRRIVADRKVLLAVFVRFEIESYKIRELLIELKQRVDTNDRHRDYLHQQVKAAGDPFADWGIWDKFKNYRIGACVTDDGSLWRATRDNKSTRPGDGINWKLIAKRGAPGKDLSGPLEELRRRVEKLEGRQ